MEQEIRETAAAPIQVDILESIFSFVPLIDLVPAMHVSREWEQAISSSLLYVNPSKPWLFFHQQNIRFPNKISTSAYDTRSKSWMQIDRPAPPSASSLLRSSHSGLLYMMSPSSLLLSSDPFHLKWHQAAGLAAPVRWRTDPIVALVGEKIIVAGCGSEIDDIDPLAVEIYDMKTRSRESGESMPAGLKDSAASTWVSVATDHKILYVMEKNSGLTHTFDAVSKTWSKHAEDVFLSPDRNGFNYIITFTGGRLILIGLIGDVENAVSMKVWSVNPENLLEIEEIGEMPKEMFYRMKNESFQVSTISACSAGNWVYIYNPCEIGDVYVCELMINGGCRWTLEKVPMKNGRSSWKTVAVTCSEVGIYDVDEAFKTEKWTCVPM